MTGLISLKHRLAVALGGLGQWSGRLRSSAVGLLYPPRCVLCEADLAQFLDGPMLCAACNSAMGPLLWSGCHRCGAPSRDETPPQESCPLCRGSSFDFEAAVALGTYADRLKEAVLQMKWPGAEPIAGAMGELLCCRRADPIRLLCPSLVVPVPMHWRRRWVRKMNGPDILAAKIAKLLRVPCRLRLLRLNRNIKPQKGLNPRDRRKNVIGAFRVAKGYDMRGARVLLVDDVLTTGATCDAAAKALKEAGAASVVVAVLARTVGESNP